MSSSCSFLYSTVVGSECTNAVEVAIVYVYVVEYSAKAALCYLATSAGHM